jgi:hypothetical protein
MSPARPTRVNAVLIETSSAATTRSHAIASAAPAPTAWPSTAATTGLGPCQMARTTRCTASTLGRASAGGIRRMVVMSPPAQNVPPAPVSTTARTVASVMAVSSASASTSRNSRSSALCRSGRFNVTIRTGPSSATSTVSGTSDLPGVGGSPSEPSRHRREFRNFRREPIRHDFRNISENC